MSGPFLFRVIQAYVAGVQLPFLRSATLNPPGRISQCCGDDDDDDDDVDVDVDDKHSKKEKNHHDL